MESNNYLEERQKAIFDELTEEYEALNLMEAWQLLIFEFGEDDFEDDTIYIYE